MTANDSAVVCRGTVHVLLVHLSSQVFQNFLTLFSLLMASFQTSNDSGFPGVHVQVISIGL